MKKKQELSPLDQALDTLIPNIKNQKDFDEVYWGLRKRLLERDTSAMERLETRSFWLPSSQCDYR